MCMILYGLLFIYEYDEQYIRIRYVSNIHIYFDVCVITFLYLFVPKCIFTFNVSPP